MISEDPSGDTSSRNYSGSLRMGFDILKCLAESRASMGTSQVVLKTGLPKATVYRLLQTLKMLGYVEQRIATKKYALSPIVFDLIHTLATPFLPSQEALQVIRQTAEQYSCRIILSLLIDQHLLTTFIAGSFEESPVLSPLRQPLSTLGGRVLVAGFPENEWTRFEDSKSDTNEISPKTLEELRAICIEKIGWDDSSDEENCFIAAPLEEPSQVRRFSVTLIFPRSYWSMHSRKEFTTIALTLARRAAVAL